MTFLKISNLAVGYRRQLVLQGLSAAVLKGQVIGVLGPNGAGKTTLLKTLAGLLAPLQGTVWLEGADLSQLNPEDLSRRRAILPAVSTAPDLLTAFEVAALGRYPYTNRFGRLTAHDRNIVREALQQVDALDLALRYFHQLSDGEKQRVLLARALAQEPELLILDEPTNYLDLRHRLELLQVFNHLSRERGTTIILAHHQPDLALKSCDLVLLIKQTQLLGAGSPERVLTATAIKNLYGLRSGAYSHLLGGVEFPGHHPAQIFVIAGNGTGTEIYRQLVKAGLGFATGVIHQNDLDFHIAQAMGADLISEQPFAGISQSALAQAAEKLAHCRLVIDSAYPLGIINQANLELTRKALAAGKLVLTRRGRDENEQLFGTELGRFHYLAPEANLRVELELCLNKV